MSYFGTNIKRAMDILREDDESLSCIHRPDCDDPKVVGCECGQNAQCLTCGYGRGSWPCECRPMEEHDYELFF